MRVKYERFNQNIRRFFSHFFVFLRLVDLAEIILNVPIITLAHRSVVHLEEEPHPIRVQYQQGAQENFAHYYISLQVRPSISLRILEVCYLVEQEKW